MWLSKPRRVVVTGMGIISCIGNDLDAVTSSLKNGTSGISYAPEYAEMGFRSHVYGKPDIDLDALIDRKQRRFMGDGAAYNYLAMQQAIADSGLSDDDVSNERTGIIVGSGGPSTRNQIEAADITREKGPKRVGPYMVPRCMSSTNSAVLATSFKIKGVNYSISSACSTSGHCIGNAAELIQMGKQDIVFAGGGEELDWTLSVLFDSMGALSSKYNDAPQTASRPYDATRDGFVISGGAGTIVLEELEHALARGAKIYGEVIGYGATSDGYDMVAPSGEGAQRCMKQAMATIDLENKGRLVSYINSHGTSTGAGDITEINAIKNVFEDLGQDVPDISSTKSMTGHSLGATGVQEAIYSMIMMRDGFIAPNINVTSLDEGAAGVPVVTQKKDKDIDVVLSNSFGFGGTNCCLVMGKYHG